MDKELCGTLAYIQAARNRGEGIGGEFGRGMPFTFERAIGGNPSAVIVPRSIGESGAVVLGQVGR